MSSNFNLVVIEGNVVRDPSVSYTEGGLPVVNFTVANNQKYKDKESTLFLDCTAFGSLAEVIVKYASKGKRLLVSGELRDDSYTNEAGVKIHRVKLYLGGHNALRFIGGFDGANNNTTDSDASGVDGDAEVTVAADDEF